MATASIVGKERVGSAKKLAKACGLEVLGWNDKSGKEFLSVQGDGDKLEQLRKELEKTGWHAWPVAEGQEGHFMDFGMRPPPVGSPAGQSGMTVVDLPPEPMTNSNSFRYRGPGGLYLNNLLALTIPLVVLWAVRVKEVVTLPVAERMGFWCLVIALILLPMHWVEISGDGSGLTIRKHFFGKRKVVPFSNIKQARVIEQQKTRYGRVVKNGWATWFLAVNVRSGKSFDLYLSKKKLAELAAFIKRRITA
jgi:hypothetical protein